jgi:hypothetical protein
MVLNREITPPDRWPIMIPMRRLSFVVRGAGTQVRSSRCLRRRSIEGVDDHAARRKALVIPKKDAPAA